MNRNPAVIKKIRYKINTHTPLKLYNTMILSHNHCLIGIDTTDSNTSKLHRIHLIHKHVPVLKIVL